MSKSLLTALIIHILIVSASAANDDSNQIELHRMGTSPAIPSGPARKDVHDTNEISDANDGLQEDWNKLDEKEKDEVRQWSMPGSHERVGLLKASNHTAKTELVLIRKMASKENAQDTVMAIDKILAKRQKRYDELISKAEEEKKKQRKRTERIERKRLSVEERRRLLEEKRNKRRSKRESEPELQMRDY